MSRKDLLSAKPDPATAGLSAEARTAQKASLPLLGMRRVEDPRFKLAGNVHNALQEATARSQRAEEIERRLAEGQAVIFLKPSEIEPSFISDRMPGSSEDHDSLVASIHEQGQQVPILVRPHPTEVGRYQVAFGHRRLRALIELDRPVSAIVRDLTDEQLVVAQGQENSERQDLTFIEKARFAQRLQSRFSREVVVASLSVDKSLISKMLSIVDVIPADVIDAIGPAPGVGRRSWEEMSGLLGKQRHAEGVLDFVRSEKIQALASADRFKAAVVHLKPRKTARPLPGVWLSNDGVQLAKVSQNAAKLDISIDRRQAPEFAAFVVEKLQSLFNEHRSNGWRPESTKNGE